MDRPTKWCVAAALLALAACGSRSHPVVDGPDAGRAARDAGPGAADAGSPTTPDAGPTAEDAGPPTDLRLARALTCALEAPDVRRAVVRHVACDRETRATVRGLVEAWEAGLFGSFETYVEDTAGYPFQFGCDAWRCLAAATSCVEHDECLAGVREGGCDDARTRCDGTVLERCLPSRSGAGEGFAPVFDCAAVGAGCVDGRCELDGCAFGSFAEELRCDGDDVALCEGAATIDCGAWRPGTSCQYFAIGGEIPTRSCLPSGFGGAGAYPTDVECDDAGVIRFPTALEEEVVIDCVAEGYAGCDPRGCVP
ncbi:MAG TPA: hypothetical protein RMH99_17260 [Sandaracinaceae bacterium LLY-WYZ-13_1]|nr:hypothetical protein [Sandaracinaceae bacterium LLY-WYZ-13_1]